MSWVSDAWEWYRGSGKAPSEAIAPLITLLTALGAGLFALKRHFQTLDADLQRRITESFSKATEQLGSDKIEVRLGGIYTLERISRESPDDDWTVMETLCAFVRERARWKPKKEASSETVARFYEKAETTESIRDLPTDIEAVLAVIIRRDQKSLQREIDNGWRLDFRTADLSETYLSGANLRGANLSEANLRGAYFSSANLIEAYLRGADLREAILWEADLRGANLGEANLAGADLRAANLTGAHLDRANLSGADLEGANLSETNVKP